VIARIWHGTTTPANASAYEELLADDVIPGLDRLEGYRGAYVLRREIAGGVEFVTLTMFDSLEAIRAFAGDDVEAAVVAGPAARLLSRFDERSAHYETLLQPGARRTNGVHSRRGRFSG
jgi:heme-degrading monooxygenase HmoA